jgi:hypothetical protein
LNCIDSRYEQYALKADVQARASVDAAIAAAAWDALVGAIAVGPLPIPQFGTPALQALPVAQVNTAYAMALGGIPDGVAKDDGITFGQSAQQRFLHSEAQIMPPPYRDSRLHLNP